MKHIHYVICATLIILFMLLAVFIRPNNITYTLVMNSYQFTNDTNESPKIQNKECLMYELPQFKEIPKAPIDQIKKLSPNDTKRIDELMVEYASSLYHYIQQLQKELKETHQSYQLTCQKP